MEDTPLLQKRLKEFKSQLGQYSGTRNNDWTAGFGFDALTTKIYVAVPVGIFLLLVVSRPSFIKDEQNDGTKKLSWQKLFMYWLVISAVIVLGIFGYNYKREST